MAKSRKNESLEKRPTRGAVSIAAFAVLHPLRPLDVGDTVCVTTETSDMPVEKWSDRVIVARLGDDPLLTEDLLSLDRSANHTPRDIVLDFSSVSYVNSSHLSRLLELRKKTITDDGRMMLCGLRKQVWGAFMATKLDQIFNFTDDVTTALATLQLEQ